MHFFCNAVRLKCPACFGGKVAGQAGNGDCVRCSGTGKESDYDYKARMDSGWKP